MHFFKLSSGHLSLILPTQGKVYRMVFSSFFPKLMKEGINASVCPQTQPCIPLLCDLPWRALGADNVSSSLLKRQTNLRQFVFHIAPNKLSD